jgi:hypothetical protein
MADNAWALSAASGARSCSTFSTCSEKRSGGLTEDQSSDAYSPQRLTRIQGPFFGGVGLSCTHRQKQALRGGAIGTDSLLQLTS